MSYKAPMLKCLQIDFSNRILPGLASGHKPVSALPTQQVPLHLRHLPGKKNPIKQFPLYIQEMREGLPTVFWLAIPLVF